MKQTNPLQKAPAWAPARLERLCPHQWLPECAGVHCGLLLVWSFVCFHPPPPLRNTVRGVCWNLVVHLSVCLSICPSIRPSVSLSVCPCATPLSGRDLPNQTVCNQTCFVFVLLWWCVFGFVDLSVLFCCFVLGYFYSV